jgi:hypothetical protein
MQSNIGRKWAGKCLGNIANEPCKINKKIWNVKPPSSSKTQSKIEADD